MLVTERLRKQSLRIVKRNKKRYKKNQKSILGLIRKKYLKTLKAELNIYMYEFKLDKNIVLSILNELVKNKEITYILKNDNDLELISMTIIPPAPIQKNT